MRQKSKRATRKDAGQEQLSTLSTNGGRNLWCVETIKPRKRTETMAADDMAVTAAGALQVWRGHKLIRSFKPGHWESAHPRIRVQRSRD
jgi:hypothetical protein